MKTLRTLFRNDAGATVVEFGLLLPVILTGFLGVLQVGIAMLAYNGMRNVTAEASRYALVEYQNSRTMGSWAAIETYAENKAPNNGLTPSKFELKVANAPTQRVSGAIELTMTATYQVTSVLPFLGLKDFETKYSRPLFLIDES